MADLYWIGDSGSSNASVASNWHAGSPTGANAIAAPGSSDTAHFGWWSSNDCNWNIAAVNKIEYDTSEDDITSGTFGTITSNTTAGTNPQENPDKTQYTSRYRGGISIANDVALNGLILDGVIKATGAYTLTFSGTAPYDNRYVKNGENAEIVGYDDHALAYKFSGGTFYMGTGPHPTVIFHTGTFRPQWTLPYSS